MSSTPFACRAPPTRRAHLIACAIARVDVGICHFQIKIQNPNQSLGAWVDIPGGSALDGMMVMDDDDDGNDDDGNEWNVWNVYILIHHHHASSPPAIASSSRRAQSRASPFPIRVSGYARATTRDAPRPTRRTRHRRRRRTWTPWRRILACSRARRTP